MNLAVALTMSVVSTSPLVSSPAPSSSTLTPCVLTHPAGLRAHAQCGAIDVDVGGKAGSVTFAVLPATGADAVGPPLFLIAGGPGQSATRDFVPLLGALAGIREDRPLVLMDVRGTGRSMPHRK